MQIYWYTKFCTTQEGFKKHAITTSASTGFAVIFSFQNTSVNFLHVVLNQPGIFTKKGENPVPTANLAIATSWFDNNSPIIPYNYRLMVYLKQQVKVDLCILLAKRIVGTDPSKLGDPSLIVFKGNT